MSAPLDIVDIHAHVWPPAYAPGGAREKKNTGFAPEIERKITSPEALLSELETGGVSLAIITATIESLFGLQGETDQGIIAETNDWLGELTAQHPDRLGAFATVDAFSGDAGAREAERAITKAGLSGLVIDSSRNGRFLSDPGVRPTLEVAARLRVPIFVHPVSHPDAATLIAAAGKNGNSIGRGLMNGVALLSVLEASLLDDFPDLNLIFATLGLGALVQAARGGKFGREAREAGERPNIYFDTMGDDPAIISTLVGFFGVERVLAGTDWPILSGLSRERFADSLQSAGLNEAEQRLVAGGNARRIIGDAIARREAAE